VGGVWGRYCAPSPGDRQAVLVASQFTRGTSGFRVAGGETVCHGSVSVCGSARRWWGDVEGSMPCRCMRRARLDEAQVHENGTRALGTLGGSVASNRWVRGASHGRLWSDLPRGIEPWVLG
jgi:hypothetical protein